MPLSGAERQARYKERNPARSAQTHKEQYALRRAFIDAAKAHPCTDCGERHPPYCMDFDHVRGEKLFGIGPGVASHGLKALATEIAKCDLVCANCHRRRHYE